MTGRDVRVGVIGPGNVFPSYARGIRLLDGITLHRVAARDASAARRAAEAYAAPEWGDLDALLNDDAVDIAVNLTPPAVHADIVGRTLEASIDTFVEKPFAASLPEADELIALSRLRGAALGCAPDVFLGPAGQTARAALDDGMIGRPFAASSFIRSSRTETWHPDPRGFYGPLGGPVLDWGPYHVTTLVNLFGPVRRVIGAGVRARETLRVSSPGRVVDTIPVDTPTHVSAVLEHECGVLVTAMYSFDVWDTDLPHIEVYGTEGTLALPDPTRLHGPVRLRRHGDADWITLPRRSPSTMGGIDVEFRGLGVAELATRTADAAERIGPAPARHVLEVLLAIRDAAFDSGAITIASSMERPPTMPLGPSAAGRRR